MGAEMGGLLYQLIGQKPGRRKPIPKDVLIEAEIAKRVLSDLPSVNYLGHHCFLIALNAGACYGEQKAHRSYVFAAIPGMPLRQHTFWLSKPQN